MDRPREYYVKWTKWKREIPYDFTYMLNLKYKTNEQTKWNKPIHRYRKQTDGWGRRCGGKANKYKLAVIK